MSHYLYQLPTVSMSTSSGGIKILYPVVYGALLVQRAAAQVVCMKSPQEAAVVFYGWHLEAINQGRASLVAYREKRVGLVSNGLLAQLGERAAGEQADVDLSYFTPAPGNEASWSTAPQVKRQYESTSESVVAVTLARANGVKHELLVQLKSFHGCWKITHVGPHVLGPHGY